MPSEPLYDAQGNIIGSHNAFAVEAEVQRLQGALEAHHAETRRLYKQYQAVRAALRALDDTRAGTLKKHRQSWEQAIDVLKASESSAWDPDEHAT